MSKVAPMLGRSEQLKASTNESTTLLLSCIWPCNTWTAARARPTASAAAIPGSALAKSSSGVGKGSQGPAQRSPTTLRKRSLTARARAQAATPARLNMVCRTASGSSFSLAASGVGCREVLTQDLWSATLSLPVSWATLTCQQCFGRHARSAKSGIKSRPHATGGLRWLPVPAPV